MRKRLTFHISDTTKFKEQLLFWSKKFQCVCILDSHEVNLKENSKMEYNTYELVAGIDALQIIEPEQNCFDNLKAEIDFAKDWWFGYLGYDLKNEIENLSSDNQDGLDLPQMNFFRPRWVFLLDVDTLLVHYFEEEFSEEDIYNLVMNIQNISVPKEKEVTVAEIKSRISREEYLKAIRQLKEHIRIGDIYEVNFCQEFYAEDTYIRPRQMFRKLMKVSPTPYSCFYRMGEKYLLSASPERYLKKVGRKIISQPIKGTAKRGANEEEDKLIKENLFSDAKERAENIMIVDLVRNDLSRTAAKDSVIVEELCGIYTFPQVHQMISTIVSELKEDVHFVEAIRQTFPMGSMTGAPKVRAMKLIEKYESTKRGLFSGAVGYITPDGDFDFNVVIRSIQYNAMNHYLSFMVGGAITMQSNPEKEYEECMLKAKAIVKVLKE
ncbi:aminodeoxychorismate synthase, component I [Labilibaculum manganireducens]|uniref:aminodeoxychorismate synthase n=1 Tax=Labilibaculum manganireducens TaxID=1940525 RepID=A0A2N3I2T9_9BACT|nr:aminodeoxychorismate synthase component I [Labilibaculum manganireducens]PKQ64573.1 aminodeoxychorismate synthase, component I [Labilibaculum manganireducens]